MTTPALTLYHNPRSRSASARVLLEALGVPYAIEVIDFTSGQNRTPEFLALNPLGKLPTLVHGDALTAADLLLGTALKWTTEFGIVPKLPVIVAYMDRVGAHPAVLRAGALDAAIAQGSAPE